VEREANGCCMLNDLKLVVTSPLATSIYKNAIMSCKITKMPLWASNVGPLLWWCGNDVATMWRLSSTEY